MSAYDETYSNDRSLTFSNGTPNTNHASDISFNTLSIRHMYKLWQPSSTSISHSTTIMPGQNHPLRRHPRSDNGQLRPNR